MGPFEDIFPDLLEAVAEEAGELVGETLELQDEESGAGSPAELFSPPKKSFGLAAFDLKGRDASPVQMLFSLELAIELAGKLIMLPADEIAASKKQGSLEGELLDAFSEIANIISGVLNSKCQEALPDRKLHFVKGELQVFPGKTSSVPLPDEELSQFSGSLALNDKKLGEVRFFLPHSLAVPEEEKDAGQQESGDEAVAPEQGQAPKEAGAGEKAESRAEQASPAEAEAAAGPAQAGTQAEEAGSQAGPQEAEAEAEADAEDAPGPGPGESGGQEEEGEAVDQAMVDELLRDGLEPVQEELQALLGDEVTFVEPETGCRETGALLSNTKGKQALARIQVSGDRQGEGFMLFPLKDAVHFGGILLMMPAETISQTIKQGSFDGEISDAFGEVANILIGCYSQQFKSSHPLKLSFKKASVETLVPAKAGSDENSPLGADSYYFLSARVKVGEKTYGPLELLFPPGVLGLDKLFRAEAGKTAKEAGQAQETRPGNRKSAAGQKPVPGQKNDTAAAQAGGAGERVVSIIGDDQEQLDMIEKCIKESGVSLNRLSPDDDFNEYLRSGEPACVFLLINQVNDQGLARAIKVRSAIGRDCPLIVAGPEWTKSKVLKARKYGATDILITPADSEAVQRKYRKYV